MWHLLTVDKWAILFCAVLGAVKASIEFDANKPFIIKLLDMGIGVACGLAVVHHFANSLSIGLSCLAALIGGASGAMCLEVFMQMLPNIARTAIKNIVNKK